MFNLKLIIVINLIFLEIMKSIIFDKKDTEKEKNRDEKKKDLVSNRIENI